MLLLRTEKLTVTEEASVDADISTTITKKRKLDDIVCQTEDTSQPGGDFCIRIDCLTRGTASPLIDLLTDQTWKQILHEEFCQMYFHDLTRFLHSEIAKGKKVFPQLKNIFRALNMTPIAKVKAVILGQDPYHDDAQAVGLAFSVPAGFKLPSSLLNIYKELESDVGVPRSKNGDLSCWADEGVLLLNATLTVRAHEANSHADKGWARFTDAVIQAVNKNCSKVAFLLWGKFAEKKAAQIVPANHFVLTAAHPSGLSASRGFFGCKHFSKANAYLVANGKEPIDWNPAPPDA